MERTISYYLIESDDYLVLDSIWQWCQYSGRDIPMYTTRITSLTTGWVVELAEDDPATTFFLLNFGHRVSAIAAPYYL